MPFIPVDPEIVSVHTMADLPVDKSPGTVDLADGE